MRRTLHADQHAADLSGPGGPRLNQVVNHLPASQIQVPDAEGITLRVSSQHVANGCTTAASPQTIPTKAFTAWRWSWAGRTQVMHGIERLQ